MLPINAAAVELLVETASERVFDDSSSMLLWVLSLDCHGQIISCTTLETRLDIHTNVGPSEEQWQDVQSKPIAIDGPSHSMLKEETTLDHCLLRLIPSRQGATDEALNCLSRLVGQVRAARVHPSPFHSSLRPAFARLRSSVPCYRGCLWRTLS